MTQHSYLSAGRTSIARYQLDSTEPSKPTNHHMQPVSTWKSFRRVNFFVPYGD